MIYSAADLLTKKAADAGLVLLFSGREILDVADRLAEWFLYLNPMSVNVFLVESLYGDLHSTKDTAKQLHFFGSKSIALASLAKSYELFDHKAHILITVVSKVGYRRALGDLRPLAVKLVAFHRVESRCLGDRLVNCADTNIALRVYDSAEHPRHLLYAIIGHIPLLLFCQLPKLHCLIRHLAGGLDQRTVVEAFSSEFFVLSPYLRHKFSVARVLSHIGELTEQKIRQLLLESVHRDLVVDIPEMITLAVLAHDLRGVDILGCDLCGKELYRNAAGTRLPLCALLMQSYVYLRDHIISLFLRHSLELVALGKTHYLVARPSLDDLGGKLDVLLVEYLCTLVSCRLRRFTSHLLTNTPLLS